MLKDIKGTYIDPTKPIIIIVSYTEIAIRLKKETDMATQTELIPKEKNMAKNVVFFTNIST